MQSSCYFPTRQRRGGGQRNISVLEGDVVITEILNVPISTSSLEANASFALQTFDSQKNHLVPSSVSEVTNEVIVMAQAVQNTTQAMESITGHEKPNNSGEEPVYVLKTKSGVTKIPKCSKCNKAFSLRSTLSKHLQCHTNETNSTQFNKMHSSPVKLTTPMKTHRTPSKKEKNILCPGCAKRFHIHSKLKVHLRTHTRE